MARAVRRRPLTRLAPAALCGAVLAGLWLPLCTRALPIEDAGLPQPSPLQQLSSQPSDAPATEAPHLAPAVIDRALAGDASLELLNPFLPEPRLQDALDDLDLTEPLHLALAGGAGATRPATAGRRGQNWHQPGWVSAAHATLPTQAEPQARASRDWIAPAAGIGGGLGLSKQLGLDGPADAGDGDPRARAPRRAELSDTPVVRLPAQLRAFVRDHLPEIVAGIGALALLAALAKAYSRRV